MSALRKPKHKEQRQLVLKLDPAAAPDPAIGETIWDWHAQASFWTPEQARQKLIDFAEDLEDDPEPEGYFIRLLTITNEAGPDLFPNFVPFPAEALPIMARHVVAFVKANFPAKIPTPKTTQHRQKMEAAERVHVQDGVAYRPLPVAAKLGQTPTQTLRDWIRNGTEFAGRPLETVYIPAVDRYLVSEESIERMAQRFVKWPSGEPAGAVTIGATKDKSGYLGTTEAAQVLAVSSRTPWLWAKEGKAPTDKPLDVVKCTTSERYYIRERDVYDLKKRLPKSGLSRGRRPQQLTPQ